MSVIVLTIGGVLTILTIPKASAQLPLNYNPVMVNITLPLNDITQPVNQPVSVYAEAFGNQPIQDLELSINGIPFSQKLTRSKPGIYYMSGTWAWTPAKEGNYTMLVSAITEDGGQAGISNVVTVNVMDQAQLSTPTPQATLPAPTLDESAAATQMAMVQSITPVSPPEGFLDVGSPIIPLPPAPGENTNNISPAEPSKQPADNILPVDITLWSQSLIQNLFPVSEPVAPNLTGGPNQCEAILVIQDNTDNEAGFFIYRIDDLKFPFGQRIATLNSKAGKKSFSYHDPGQTIGVHSYYVSAFNTAGEASSKMVNIQITDSTCANAKPQELNPENIPVNPAQPVDKVYCYVSADSMPWVRLPNGQDNFIEAINGKFDLLPYLSQIPLPRPVPFQVNLIMECWGWSGSNLVYLGATNQTLTGNVPPDPGEPTPSPLQDTAAPFNLHFAGNPEECRDYQDEWIYKDLAVEICDQQMKLGNKILLWNWTPYSSCIAVDDPTCENKYVQNIEWFYVYQTETGPTGGATKLVTGSSNKLRYASVKLNYNPGVVFQPEFFVRAMPDMNDHTRLSPDSNHVQGNVIAGNTIVFKDPILKNKTYAKLIGDPDWGPVWGLSATENPVLGWWYVDSADFDYTYWYNYWIILNYPPEQLISQINGPVTQASIKWNRPEPDVLHDFPPCGMLSVGAIGFEGPLLPNKKYDITAEVQKLVLDAHYSQVYNNLEVWFRPTPHQDNANLGTWFPDIPEGVTYECSQYMNNFELEVNYLPIW